MKPATRIKMMVMGYIASDARRRLAHVTGRLARRGKPVVHYFHQVDDPYSHLVIQKLDLLGERYKVTFVPHLVSSPSSEEQGDSERFRDWALRDARSVASDYGTTLPEDIDKIPDDQVLLAESCLAQFLDAANFTTKATEIGNHLWRNEQLSQQGDSGDKLEEGTALRAKLGHYLSATFYFEGEWYWGLDRLFHLENRLRDMGLSNDPESICVPRPEPEALGIRDASAITLEYFPSLRSPYTAISFDRTMNLVERSGVNLELKPVMPMMMRGIPAPRAKQLYIMSDTRREADYYGQPFGPIVDPFGEPVKRAFSLFPYMVELGKEVEYCSNYLKAAWAEGIDITTDAGLQLVVERSGVNWQDARNQFDNSEWQPLLECNVSDMLEAGLWGVSSFRVTGGNSATSFCCWGQDRLWRVESEIARRASGQVHHYQDSSA